MRLSRRVSSFPAWRPIRNGEEVNAISRRTPFGSITTSRGARGMGLGSCRNAQARRDCAEAHSETGDMVGNLASEVNTPKNLESCSKAAQEKQISEFPTCP